MSTASAEEVEALRKVVDALPKCCDCRDPRFPATKGSDKRPACDTCALKYPDGDWYDLDYADEVRALRAVIHPVAPISTEARALILRDAARRYLSRCSRTTQEIREALDDAMKARGLALPTQVESDAVFALPEIQAIGERWRFVDP